MRRRSVVVLGMMAKMPVAGVVWQTMHYLLGFERLGFRAVYVEAHDVPPYAFMAPGDESSHAQGRTRALDFLGRTMARSGFGEGWVYHDRAGDGGLHGPMAHAVPALYGSAELLVNLHGGTLPLEEHTATGRLVYLETDPVKVQVELHRREAATFELLDAHAAHFTFGESYGTPACSLPVSQRYDFRPTRQPVVVDLWGHSRPPGDTWTTIGNWRQRRRDVELDGETYTWSKHAEWAKVLALPHRTRVPFELALAGYRAHDEARLRRRGFRVRPAEALSSDPDLYRDYIQGSLAELTVAKDQNVRLKTGWFSDRSATYLAAGRPVVTQDTGFGAHLPAGEGLIPWTTVDEAVAAVEEVEADWERHAKAAGDIARECFDAEVVLGRLLDDVGVAR